MSDVVREKLTELIEAHGVDFATVSRAVGKNHAYIQQFIKRGVPRNLPEEVRHALADYFSIDPSDFSTLPRRAHSQEGMRAVIQIASQLSPQDLEAWVTVGRALTGESPPPFTEAEGAEAGLRPYPKIPSGG